MALFQTVLKFLGVRPKSKAVAQSARKNLDMKDRLRQSQIDSADQMDELLTQALEKLESARQTLERAKQNKKIDLETYAVLVQSLTETFLIHSALKSANSSAKLKLQSAFERVEDPNDCKGKLEESIQALYHNMDTFCEGIHETIARNSQNADFKGGVAWAR